MTTSEIIRLATVLAETTERPAYINLVRGELVVHTSPAEQGRILEIIRPIGVHQP